MGAGRGMGCQARQHAAGSPAPLAEHAGTVPGERRGARATGNGATVGGTINAATAGGTANGVTAGGTANGATAGEEDAPSQPADPGCMFQ